MRLISTTYGIYNPLNVYIQDARKGDLSVFMVLAFSPDLSKHEALFALNCTTLSMIKKVIMFNSLTPSSGFRWCHRS